MKKPPQLNNPPVIEFVLGVQFAPLTRLVSAHYGSFWKSLYSDWTPEDAQPLPDQFENLQQVRWKLPRVQSFRLQPASYLGRLVLNSQDKCSLVQFQNTRFHRNWKKTDSQKPSFTELRSTFFHELLQLHEYLAKNDLGELQINQWELTYVDRIDDQPDPLPPLEWTRVFPNLFTSMSDFSGLSMELEFRSVDWSFKLPSGIGRLHVSASPGTVTNDPNAEMDSLIMNWTARGPASSIEEAMVGLQSGHDSIIDLFFTAASPEFLEKWGIVK
jgi:uncharacterized protein (TIGR04255 family)